MSSSPGVENDGGGVLGAHPRLHPGDDDDDGRPVRTFEPIVGCAAPPPPRDPTAPIRHEAGTKRLGAPAGTAASAAAHRAGRRGRWFARA